MIQDTFCWQHRVSYAECTLGNHVYHARYLDILERARGEFFRHLGHPLLDLQEADVIFPVIDCRLRFKAAARYDDPIQVKLRVTELGRVRVAFGHTIQDNGGRLLVEAETVHACTTVGDRLRRLPDDLRAAFQRFLGPAQAGGADSSSN